MNKYREIQSFTYKDRTYSEMVDYLNHKLPINLSLNEDLINKIHVKYPILSKTEISIVVKGIFQSIRDLLVANKILNFNTLFFNAKLLCFPQQKTGYMIPRLKVKIETPPTMRKL